MSSEATLEIEVNRIVEGTKNREIRVWMNGSLVYANAIATPRELREWRDALHNELLWLERYLRAEGLEDKQ